MTASRARARARARGLVRLYPAAWRARYGVEFEQLLADQLAEGDGSPAWWADVLTHAVRARLAGAAGRWLAGAIGLFVLCGVGVWSQLAVGWQWSAPTSGQTRVGVEVLSLGLLGLAAVGVAGLLVLAAGLGQAVRQGTSLPKGACLVAVAAVAVLVLGAGWIGTTWPGTGGHAWAGRGLAPAWLARRTWALTLWISSFWAHPRELGALGGTQVAWMALTPGLLGGLAWATTRLMKATILRRRDRQLLVGAAYSSLLAMALVVAGAGSWALGDSPGPHGLFAPGAIDAVLVAVALCLLLLAGHLCRGMLAEGPRSRRAS